MSVARLIRSTISVADNTIVNVACMQLLDASLRLLPMSELIESLSSLLGRADDNVSEKSQCSRRRS